MGLTCYPIDVCELLGIQKLSTTAYHPRCDGMAERFNRTLKSMIRKHVPKFGSQWDCYLSGLLWAYRNTPHGSTGEKPSFLLFGVDCRSPTKAALLPDHPLEAFEVADYREELVLSLSAAWTMAAEAIRHAQAKYKIQWTAGNSGGQDTGVLGSACPQHHKFSQQ